ncbi:20859_t:CDS:2, partial [Gigaspora margarita]
KIIENAIIKVEKKILSSKDIKNELEKQSPRSKESWSESAKEKKARWFVEIERRTFLNNVSKLVKDEFQLDKKVQQTVRPPLSKHKKDKRSKDWIIFEDQRSKSWMLGRIEKKKKRKLSVEHWVERKEK